MCADEREVRRRLHAQMVSARVYLRCAWCVRFACRKRFGKIALSAYYGQGTYCMPQAVQEACTVGILYARCILHTQAACRNRLILHAQIKWSGIREKRSAETRAMQMHAGRTRTMCAKSQAETQYVCMRAGKACTVRGKRRAETCAVRMRAERAGMPCGKVRAETRCIRDTPPKKPESSGKQRAEADANCMNSRAGMLRGMAGTQ